MSNAYDELREYLQRVRGICSEVTCDAPITGYILGGRKLCARHLYGYLMAHPQAGAFLYPTMEELDAQARRRYPNSP